LRRSREGGTERVSQDVHALLNTGNALSAAHGFDLGGLRCLEDPPAQATLRVIVGARYLGRMKHNMLAAGPEFVIPERRVRPQQVRAWWVRSCDPSYREVHLHDLRSVKDLAETAYDAGAQLGAGYLRDDAIGHRAERKQALDSLKRLETHIRTETSRLVEGRLREWRSFGGH
jgi:hypothetical protein